MSKQVRVLLEHADPARGVVIGGGDGDAVLRRAATDITPYEAEAVPPRRPVRRTVLAAATAAVAVVAAAGALALPRSAPEPPPGTPAAPGTPGAGTSCLAALAEQIAPAPYDGRSGRYEYLHTRGMGGITSEVPGKTTFATAQWEIEVKVWTAADGSGRQVTDRGPVQYPDQASRAFFTTHPDALGAAHQDRTVTAGERPLRALPEADPTAMATQLYQPRENGPSAALVGVADLNAERLLDAPHRAAVLRFLAATDGITCAGETHTEAGTGLLVRAQAGQGPHPSPATTARKRCCSTPAPANSSPPAPDPDTGPPSTSTAATPTRPNERPPEPARHPCPEPAGLRPYPYQAVDNDAAGGSAWTTVPW